MKRYYDRGMTVLGGLVATLAMTVFLHVVLPLSGEDPSMLSRVFENLIDAGWLVGMLVHLFLGAVVFPLIFVNIRGRLPGPMWVRGTAWGAALWFVAEAVVVPLSGGGLFHATSGGLPVALLFLAAHLLYGASLGAIVRGMGVAVPAERGEAAAGPPR